MFQFTLDDLKKTLSNLTPEVRRSLVGLYKHNEYENLGNYLIKNSLGYIEESKVYLNYSFDKVEVVNKQLNQLIKYQGLVVVTLLKENKYVNKFPFNYNDLDITNWEATFNELITKNETYTIETNLLLFELDKLIKFHKAANSIKSYCEECRVYKIKVDLTRKIAETKGLPRAIREYLINLL